VAAAVGNKGGSIGLLGGKALGVVHVILLLRDHEYIIGVVVQFELHVPHAAAIVGELLENVDAVGVDMAAVLEGIKVSRVGTLPRQHDLVGIVGITHLGVSGQGGGVGDTHGAVGITTLHAVGIHGGRLVDLRQAGIGHADGHGVGRVVVTHSEFAGAFIPGGDLVGAGGIAEELDDHVLLVILDALAQRIHIGILAQSRCLGGNGGQGADDLIIHRVAHGGGGSVSVPIGDVGQAAGVLAGGVLCFTHGLIQRRIASLILGVNGHIVIPRRAVDGSHGQRYEERIAGAGNIFGDASLHNEIQPLLHVGCSGVAGGVRFGHGYAAVFHSSFQRILDRGGVGSQCSGQLVVQHIAGEVVDAAHGLVSVCGSQADGRQNGGAAVTVVEAIQHTHLPLTVQHFIAHGDVGHAEVGELHTLDGVFCQLIHDGGIIVQAAGNVGFRIPRTVAAGRGDVVLVDGKGCFFAGVDGRLGKCHGDEAQSYNNGHEQCQYAMDLFHLLFSLFIIFELSF